MNDVKKLRQKWLVKKSKFVWRKKTHTEHKYSVTFVSKVGTKTQGFVPSSLFSIMLSGIVHANFFNLACFLAEMKLTDEKRNLEFASLLKDCLQLQSSVLYSKHSHTGEAFLGNVPICVRICQLE